MFLSIAAICLTDLEFYEWETNDLDDLGLDKIIAWLWKSYFRLIRILLFQRMTLFHSDVFDDNETMSKYFQNGVVGIDNFGL